MKNVFTLLGKFYGFCFLFYCKKFEMFAQRYWKIVALQFGFSIVVLLCISAAIKFTLNLKKKQVKCFVMCKKN